MTKTNEDLLPLSVAPLLKQLVGIRVTSLVRLSLDPKEEVPRECRCAKSDSFSLAGGPLAVGFEDGTLLEVDNDEGMISVIVCLERWRGEVVRSPRRTDLFPIDARESCVFQSDVRRSGRTPAEGSERHQASRGNDQICRVAE